ncbi:MAG: hypothetical protein KDD70_15320, partial [Bdellovibrionales bacterium]|nr:hypothetical protein [Bdellovibrionales bacterium]
TVEDRGERPPVGVAFRQEYAVVVDTTTGKRVGKIEYLNPGEIYVESSDREFDNIEPKLRDALSDLEPVHSPRRGVTYEVGKLQFVSTVDTELEIRCYTGRNTTPAIYITKEAEDALAGKIKFVDPNVMEIAACDVTPKLEPYRIPGSYLLSLESGGSLEEPKRFELAKDFQLDHHDLYYLEPISQPQMERLMCYELSQKGLSPEIGAGARAFTFELSDSDITEISSKMLDMPYAERGGVFASFDRYRFLGPTLVVNRQLLDLAIEKVTTPFDEFGSELGIDARSAGGMKRIETESFKGDNSTRFQVLRDKADKRFVEQLTRLVPFLNREDDK